MRNFTLSTLFFLLLAPVLMAQNIQRLSPAGDTYADGGHSSTVYNNEEPSRIWVKTGSSDAYTRYGYIKFDISGLTINDVGTAKLRLFCYDARNETTEIGVFNVTDSWDENTLNWDNKPDFEYPAVRIKKAIKDTYVEWNITNLVQDAISKGKTTVSLALTDINSTGKLVRFYTKESNSGKNPELKINDQVEDYQALPVIADALIRGGKYGDDNFGSANDIQVKSGSSSEDYLRKGLLKFDLGQLDNSKVSEVGTARIKLYVDRTNNASPKPSLSLLPTDNDWEENTVTFNTAPAILDNDPLRTVQVAPNDVKRYYTFDITKYVQDKLADGNSDGKISFTVADLEGANNGPTFNSKEAADFHPVLELLETPTTIPPQKNGLSDTYYVDATNGDDSNPGVTPAQAWKSLDNININTFGPGARILFKAGESWSGTLTLKGSGKEGNSIIIGKYGTGDLPQINGEGAEQTVWIKNSQFIELRNLQITNYDPSEEGGLNRTAWETQNTTDWLDKERPGNDETANTRKIGVRVTAEDMGEVKHIHLINLNIHGINGDNESKNNGGVFIEVRGTKTPTYFNDLLVEGCTIHDVDRSGVSNVSSWDDRTLTDNGNWTPSLNFIVRNNTFRKTGANALILRVAKDPMIEHNLFDGCAIKGSGNAAFNFNTDGAIMQYNEARFTKANKGDADAGGLDSDFRTKNTIIQYNYLHDNDFGMLATGGGFTGSFNDGSIFRYNIIQHDGLVARENGDLWTFKLSGAITNTKIQNNVIYIAADQKNVDLFFHKNWNGDKAENTSYTNNIFYVEGQNNGFNVTQSSGNSYSNNIFYSTNSTNDFPSAANPLTTDPKFVNVGAGTEGYRLQANSPAIGAGKVVGEEAEKDYFGNPVPENGPIDIGANQFNSDENKDTPGGFAKADFDIYLLIGQSNMAGRAEIGDLDKKPLENAYLFNGTGWDHAVAPMNINSTVQKRADLQKMNPGYTFARKLAEYTGRGIGIVGNARGGTSIEQWEKGYDGADDFDLYEEAVAQLNAAKGAGNYKGILWHQGESDQSRSSTYIAKLKKLVHDLREDTGKEVFFVAGELGKWRDSSESMNKVIRGIANHINQATYISSDGLSPLNGDSSNPHFDTYSQRILGGLYADKILENVYDIDPGVATVYSDCDFKGYKVRLKSGTYSLEELEKRGIIDNDISSIKISEGYAVKLVAKDGSSNIVDSSISCLGTGKPSSDIISVEIGKTGTLGLEKKTRVSKEITVSPNPVGKEKIHLNFDSVQDYNLNDVQLELFNLNGKQIRLNTAKLAKTAHGLEYDFSTNELSPGIYVLHLAVKNASYSVKLIVEK